MVCIAVPEEHNRSDPRFALADAKLASLEELNSDLWASMGLAAQSAEL